MHDGNPARRKVGEKRWHRKRRQPPRSLFGNGPRRLRHHRLAADAGRDDRRGCLLPFFVLGVPPGLIERLRRSGKPVLDEKVHLLDVLGLDPFGRIEPLGITRLVRHQPRDMGGKPRRIEAVVAHDPAFASEKPLPIGRNAHPKRRHHSHAGHNNRIIALHRKSPSLLWIDLPFRRPRAQTHRRR